MLIDIEVVEREIDLGDGASVLITPLTVEDYNLVIMSQIQKDIEPDKFLAILKRIIKNNVKRIDGIEVKDKDVTRPAIVSDFTSHSGFYSLTMKIFTALLNVSIMSDGDEKNSQSPVASGLLQDVSSGGSSH